MNMYLHMEIRHNSRMQYPWNYVKFKIFNYVLAIDILKNSSQNLLGLLRGDF